MPTIDFPASIQVVDHRKQLVMVDTADWTADFIMKLTQQGWRIRMDRSTASASDPTAARKRMFDLMVKGIYTGTGRGPRLDEDTEALHRWLGNEGGKKGNKTDVEARLQSLVIDMIKAETPEIKVEDLTQMVPDTKEDIRSQIEDSEAYKQYIEDIKEEKRKAEEKAKRAAAVKAPFAGLSLNRKD